MKALKQIREKLEELSLEGGIFFKPENRYYVSGFTGSTGYALVLKDKAYFITDFRYISQVKEECPDFEILEISTSKTLGDVLEELNLNSLGFEDDFMTVEGLQTLKKSYSGQLVAMKRFIENIRQIKREDEILLMKKAQSIADETFSYMLDFIKPGMSEREVYLELVTQLTQRGAQGESFKAIVASGVRGALPHGSATEKIIEKGDLLTLDFGCVYQGYCSDMTRTICVGKASEKQKEIYHVVLKAQKEALKAIKPGAICKDIDKVARDIITEAGYGENFGHGLGHAVGLEVHENPRLNMVDESILKAGMVVTDEPGIYIPGFGGVRIEDIILVTETGSEILSTSNKELIELEV
ncbi:MAG: aminopeptidase P family protein [Tissierellia bacterium]|nr:aminopeptidase P family protein [Tissierellia bacterium]